MSFNFTFGGHAHTKEGEAEIVRAAHNLWKAIKEHAENGYNQAHTTHFGVGHIASIADPDDPDKNVTTDESGDRHLDVPASASQSQSQSSPSPSSRPSGGSTDPTALAPDSYSTPTESLPQGGSPDPATPPPTYPASSSETPSPAEDESPSSPSQVVSDEGSGATEP